MSTILALATVVALIIWEMFRPRKAEKRVHQVLVQRYMHSGHGWLKVTEDGDVIVGLDDFAQSLIGCVDEVKLPRMLKYVRQGEVAWHVWHGHRMVSMVSPVSGWVTMKNEMVLHDPSLVNKAPYGDGWLFRVRPRRLSPQLRNLLSGRQSQQWIDAARAHLSRYITGIPALMYQDGGVMAENLSDRCSDDEWKSITREFFLTE